MSKQTIPPGISRTLLLPPPNRFALPPLERGQRATCLTYAAISENWPAIAAMVSAGQVAESVAAMESLAKRMLALTEKDPEGWQTTLTLARQALYDSITAVARWQGDVSLAVSPLQRCRQWDKPLSDYLTKCIQELRCDKSPDEGDR